MIRVIDRNHATNEVVQKVINPKGGLVSYQYGIPGHGMTQCSTLSEAQLAIGKLDPDLGKYLGLNKPKLTISSHA